MLLSYFRPVYEQEPTLKPRFFQTEYIGAGKKDISSSIPVDKKPISTPYDWLQSDSDMKNNISPVEIQDKKQGEFILHRAQPFIGKNAGWFQAPIQATYMNQSQTYIAPKAGAFNPDYFAESKEAEEEKAKIGIKFFY